MNRDMSIIEDAIATIRASLEDNPDIIDACINIINYLIIETENKSHLTFWNLYEASLSENPSTVIKSVYFLADTKMDILQQKFEVLDPKTNRLEEVPSNEVVETLISKDFAHPITGQELTEREYKNIVTPFFCPSDRLLEGDIRHE